MPVDPVDIIGEILGEPSATMRNPVNAGYMCPFMNSVCKKRNHSIEGPYPVCSIWKHTKSKIQEPSVHKQLVCVCPKRFLSETIITDIVEKCWRGPKPVNQRIAHEIKMDIIGNVDLVIADVSEDEKVKQFISVELQAIDITGSYDPAYRAVLNSEMLPKKPKYGFNWANVYKRFITQLIAKGYYHHHWGTFVVAVVQDVLLKDLRRRMNFPNMPLEQSNIIFASYKYVPDISTGSYNMILDEVVGTQHTNLQNAVLYSAHPSRDEFCERIQNYLKKPFL